MSTESIIDSLFNNYNAQFKHLSLYLGTPAKVRAKCSGGF